MTNPRVAAKSSLSATVSRSMPFDFSGLSHSQAPRLAEHLCFLLGKFSGTSLLSFTGCPAGKCPYYPFAQAGYLRIFQLP